MLKKITKFLSFAPVVRLAIFLYTVINYVNKCPNLGGRGGTHPSQLGQCPNFLKATQTWADCKE